MIQSNYKIEEYTIQYEELSELKYISLQELKQIVERKDDNYTFTKRAYMKKVIEILDKAFALL